MANKRFAVMRDLQDHLTAGRISAVDVGIYTIIHWQADFKSGVWWGSAPKIHATAPRGMNLRDVQRAMETLTRVGFLKPFHKHGQRGNYPVLLNKYEPLSGALKGFRLNAALSDDWRQPKYDSCALSDALTDAQDAPIQYALSSTQHETRKKSAAKPTPPADPRYKSFVDFAFESFHSKHRRAPIWNGKDWKNLKTLLREHNPEALSLARLRLLWEHFTASTEPFTTKQGDSLAYFCGNLGRFFDGPILVAHRNANGSAKEAEAFREARVGAGPELPAPRICVCGATANWHLNAAKRGYVVDHEFAEATA